MGHGEITQTFNYSFQIDRSFGWKHIGHPAFEPDHDLLQAVQGQILLTILQSLQSGIRNAYPAGKLRVGCLSSLPAEKLCELVA
jgi:hypothetical protein